MVVFFFLPFLRFDFRPCGEFCYSCPQIHVSGSIVLNPVYSLFIQEKRRIFLVPHIKCACWALLTDWDQSRLNHELFGILPETAMFLTSIKKEPPCIFVQFFLVMSCYR